MKRRTPTDDELQVGEAREVAKLRSRVLEAMAAEADWTAANADIERAERLLQDGRIKTLRLLVDRSFESRQPRILRPLLFQSTVDGLDQGRTLGTFAITEICRSVEACPSQESLRESVFGEVGN